MVRPTSPTTPASQPTGPPPPSPFVWNFAAVTADLLAAEAASQPVASHLPNPQQPRPVDLGQDLDPKAIAQDPDHAVLLARYYLTTRAQVEQDSKTLPLVQADLDHLQNDLDDIRALLVERESTA
ncbi:hypothetical protein H4R33_003059 [Dimargaris cristalligena]|uniref:Uncharacterized protein n=1 Tax=Dimargaris cristalligena TaxID=215637 RepID=A0A4P9ZL76_9FUNG|nr:hypothetical protein H4R33_003059 [Dimargaris cristalligena]RKP33332.1 hypothetical protein BJ085DRAFT_40467 [Dimargaris cristalligena]|eukprot:RKP33332.1 hypothetical protein BJ085DRAFT_40467 [Dimargaris cristalligena]